MLKSEVGEPRGILNLKAGEKKFQLSRLAPSQSLSFFVEHYWVVNWDLRGQEPYRAETLPHPSVHLVFQRGKSRVVGVVTGKFTTLLEGKGRVFGAKFKPGAFYSFVKSPVSEFTDKLIDLRDVFDVDSEPLEDAIFSLDDERMMVQLVEDFIRERRPGRDENVVVINQIVDRIVADREIVKVADITTRFNIGKRTLQRIFNQYVGVSPKWMIRRYRLHEVVEQLADGGVIDWAKLALDLGYFDQAHFIKDFKTVVGRSPAEYARNIGLCDTKL